MGKGKANRPGQGGKALGSKALRSKAKALFCEDKIPAEANALLEQFLQTHATHDEKAKGHWTTALKAFLDRPTVQEFNVFTQQLLLQYADNEVVDVMRELAAPLVIISFNKGPKRLQFATAEYLFKSFPAEEKGLLGHLLELAAQQCRDIVVKVQDNVNAVRNSEKGSSNPLVDALSMAMLIVETLPRVECAALNDVISRELGGLLPLLTSILKNAREQLDASEIVWKATEALARSVSIALSLYRIDRHLQAHPSSTALAVECVKLIPIRGFTLMFYNGASLIATQVLRSTLSNSLAVHWTTYVWEIASYSDSSESAAGLHTIATTMLRFLTDTTENRMATVAILNAISAVCTGNNEDADLTPEAWCRVAGTAVTVAEQTCTEAAVDETIQASLRPVTALIGRFYRFIGHADVTPAVLSTCGQLVERSFQLAHYAMNEAKLCESEGVPLLSAIVKVCSAADETLPNSSIPSISGITTWIAETATASTRTRSAMLAVLIQKAPNVVFDEDDTLGGLLESVLLSTTVHSQASGAQRFCQEYAKVIGKHQSKGNKALPTAFLNALATALLNADEQQHRMLTSFILPPWIKNCPSIVGELIRLLQNKSHGRCSGTSSRADTAAAYANDLAADPLLKRSSPADICCPSSATPRAVLAVVSCAAALVRKKNAESIKQASLVADSSSEGAWYNALGVSLDDMVSVVDLMEDSLRIALLDLTAGSEDEAGQVPTAAEVHLWKCIVMSGSRNQRPLFRQVWERKIGHIVRRCKDHLPTETSETAVEESPALAFLLWLTRVLPAYIYAQCPYDRRLICLSALREMYLHLCPAQADDTQLTRANVDDVLITSEYRSRLRRMQYVREKGYLSSSPYAMEIRSKLIDGSVVRTLLTCLLDNWNQVRDLAFDCLMQIPSPYNGLSADHDIATLVKYALHLISSPRPHEFNAGSMIWRLIVVKYVLPFGWKVVAHFNHSEGQGHCAIDVSVDCNTTASTTHDALISMFDSFLRFLEAMDDACTVQTLYTCAWQGTIQAVHGLLDTLFSLQVWRPASDEQGQWWAATVQQRLLPRLEAIFLKCLRVLSHVRSDAPSATSADAEGGVSAPAMTLDLAGDDAVDIVEMFSQLHLNTYDSKTAADGDAVVPVPPLPTNVVTDCRGHINISSADGTDVQEASEADGDELLAAEFDALMIANNSWLTIAELSGTFGRISDIISSSPEEMGNLHQLVTPDVVQRLVYLEFFLCFHSKHFGAIEKSQSPFQHLLVNVFKVALRAEGGELYRELTHRWLHALLNRVASDEACVLRRSAGLPYCIRTYLNAELPGTNAELFHITMKRLLDNLEGTQGRNDEQAVVARAHVFNILEVLFKDAGLYHFAKVYATRAFDLVLKGLCDPAWMCRNSALLCYTSLLRRITNSIRALDSFPWRCLLEKVTNTSNINEQVSDGHLRVTGKPANQVLMRTSGLYDVVLRHVRLALKSEDNISIDDVRSGRVQYPEQGTLAQGALYPCLMLLSQMGPLSRSSQWKADIDVLKPFIDLCLASPRFMVRSVAARASPQLSAADGLWTELEAVLDAIVGSPMPLSVVHVHGMLMQCRQLLDAALQQIDFKQNDDVESLRTVAPKIIAVVLSVATNKGRVVPMCCVQAFELLRTFVDFVLHSGMACASDLLTVDNLHRLHDDALTPCLDATAYREEVGAPYMTSTACAALGSVGAFACLVDDGENCADIVEAVVHNFALVLTTAGTTEDERSAVIDSVCVWFADPGQSRIPNRLLHVDDGLLVRAVVENMKKETFPRTIQMSLRILSFISRRCETVPQHALRLVHDDDMRMQLCTWALDESNSYLRGEAITSLGSYISVLSRSSDVESDAYSHLLNVWAKVLSQTVIDTKDSVNIRSSVLSACTVSGLALNESEALCEYNFCTWKALAALANDDLDTVREEACAYVSAVLAEYQQIDGPLAPLRVHELLYEHITKRFRPEISWIDEWVTGTIIDADAIESTIDSLRRKASAKSPITGHVFEKEQDNFFSERVEEYQLLSLTLKRLLGSYSTVEQSVIDKHSELANQCLHWLHDLLAAMDSEHKLAYFLAGLTVDGPTYASISRVSLYLAAILPVVNSPHWAPVLEWISQLCARLESIIPLGLWDILSAVPGLGIKSRTSERLDLPACGRHLLTYSSNHETL